MAARGEGIGFAPQQHVDFGAVDGLANPTQQVNPKLYRRVKLTDNPVALIMSHLSKARLLGS
jgi:hypothetical protein